MSLIDSLVWMPLLISPKFNVCRYRFFVARHTELRDLRGVNPTNTTKFTRATDFAKVFIAVCYLYWNLNVPLLVTSFARWASANIG
jgi:hypothetical protein